MNTRLIVAFVALVALGALALTASRSHEAATEIQATTQHLPKIDKNEITHLAITVPGRPTIKLDRVEGKWNLSEPLATRAEAAAVDAVLDNLRDLEVSSVAATRKENHRRLQVSPDLAIHVEAQAKGKTVVDLYVGLVKRGGTLVRSEGSDTTLLVPGTLRFTLEQDVRMFRNRVITDFDPSEVIELEVESVKGKFKFELHGGTWRQAAGEVTIPQLSPDKVQKLASAFARLRTTDYANADATPEQLGLAPPRARLTLIKKDGSVVVLALGSEAKKKANLSVTGDPVVYRIPSSTAELMQPDAAAFMEPGSVGEPLADGEAKAPETLER